MNTTDQSEPGAGLPGTIAATFTDRTTAHDALHDLHDAGFRNVWLGVTHGGSSASSGVTVTSEDSDEGGVMGSIGRFFSGEGPREKSLHEALTEHGLTHDEAIALENTVPAGAAIVTVDAENDPESAAEILQTCGGTLARGAAPARTSPAAAVAVSEADTARRLQLREERLLIDKQRVSGGEARVGKEVISEQQSIDVPVFHEELFIQRRPVNETIATSTIPIDGTEEIRIPLSAERVDVEKVTVVTEEVEIGTRSVGETEHITETIRHEELRVDGVTGTTGVAGTTGVTGATGVSGSTAVTGSAGSSAGGVGNVPLNDR